MPDDTDILLVHGPPKGHLDFGGKGCPNLLRELRRVRPSLVVFGHIHAGHGREDVVWGNGVLNAYHVAMLGGAGWATVMTAIWWTIWNWVIALMARLSVCERRHVSNGTLVNAAMFVGKDNSPQDAI